MPFAVKEAVMKMQQAIAQLWWPYFDIPSRGKYSSSVLLEVRSGR